MKPFIYLLLISQTFFLSACQANEMYPEFIFEKDTLQLDHKTIPTSTIPSYVDNTNENAMSESPSVTPSTPVDEEVNEEEHLQEEHLQIETTTKDETSLPVLPEVEEEVPSLTQPSQTTQTLYLENGPVVHITRRNLTYHHPTKSPLVMAKKTLLHFNLKRIKL